MVSFNEASTLGLLLGTAIASQKTKNFGKLSRDTAIAVHEIAGVDCFLSFVPPLSATAPELAPLALSSNPRHCEHSGAVYVDGEHATCTACGEKIK